MTATSTVIRPLKASDYDNWRPLWDGYNTFYGRSGETALPEPVTAHTWARLTDPAQAMFGLAALRAGQMVGITHYFPHASTNALKPNIYLQDLFVEPGLRGGGIGRSLIEAVREQAITLGAGSVYWQTHATNVVARRLYDAIVPANGFIVYQLGL